MENHPLRLQGLLRLQRLRQTPTPKPSPTATSILTPSATPSPTTTTKPNTTPTPIPAPPQQRAYRRRAPLWLTESLIKGIPSGRKVYFPKS